MGKYNGALTQAHQFTWVGVFTKPQKPHQNRPQNGITALHHIAWCSAVCGFIIRKCTNHTASHPLYILIYLFIFNIKYIINSLITLVFKKKFNNPIKC